MLPEAVADFCNENVAFNLEEVCKYPAKYLTSPIEEKRRIAQKVYIVCDQKTLQECNKCNGAGIIPFPWSLKISMTYCYSCMGTGYENGPHFDFKKNILFHPDNKVIKGWKPKIAWKLRQRTPERRRCV